MFIPTIRPPHCRVILNLEALRGEDVPGQLEFELATKNSVYHHRMGSPPIVLKAFSDKVKMERTALHKRSRKRWKITRAIEKKREFLGKIIRSSFRSTLLIKLESSELISTNCFMSHPA
ncbi:hypothetical protein PoB_006668400 [Plakobranchus ocellatus]|uniref:Uncharacterized protein n=1 Tax=Plakobranchus ocellatus TaxID=259542 RepID=A0AAV4D7J6_9GAST|nr:hypothetical protein PoB_006668400 [Plakobranchus ocellatus]